MLSSPTLADTVDLSGDAGAGSSSTNAVLLFSEWAERVMASRAHLAEAIRNRDQTYLRTMILPRLGDHQLSRIAPADLRELVADLVAEGKAPATVRKAHQNVELGPRVL